MTSVGTPKSIEQANQWIEELRDWIAMESLRKTVACPFDIDSKVMRKGNKYWEINTMPGTVIDIDPMKERCAVDWGEKVTWKKWKSLELFTEAMQA